MLEANETQDESVCTEYNFLVGLANTSFLHSLSEWGIHLHKVANLFISLIQSLHATLKESDDL